MDHINPFDLLHLPSAIDGEAVAKDARTIADPLALISDKLGLPDDIADALAPAFRGAPVNTIDNPSQECRDFARRIIRLAKLPVLTGPHDELLWAPWRCVFAGFGHSMHTYITAQIQTTHPNCPWSSSESEQEWYDEAIAARKTCGLSLGIIRVPWQTYVAAYPVTSGHAPGWDNLLDYAAIIELARYARRRHPTVGHEFVWLGMSSRLCLTVLNPTQGLRQSLSKNAKDLAIAFSLTASSQSKRTPDYHLPSVCMTRAMTRVTLNHLSYLKPVSSLGPMVILAPYPTQTASSHADGLIPVLTKVHGAWDLAMKNGAVRLTPKDPTISLLDVDWPEVPADAHSVNELFEADVAAVPATTRMVLPPHEHLDAAFPNIECPISDQNAYVAMFDTIMIGPYLLHSANKSEYPLIFATPHDPTQEGSTFTGKTALAEGLARVFAPAVRVRTVTDTGAPGARAFAAGLASHGTAAVDEYVAFGLAASHPLHDSNLFTLSTGGKVDPGKVHSNEAHPVGLQYPLALSAKVVHGRTDVYNRGFKLELTRFVKGSAKQTTYDALRTGQWSFNLSLDCRILAETLSPVVAKLHPTLSMSSDSWRFPVHRTAAAYLLSIRENIPLADAADRIDRASVAMVDRFVTQASLSTSNGLTATSADGSGINTLALDCLVNEDMIDDDQFLQMTASGQRYTINSLIDIARTTKNKATVSDLFVDIYGKEFYTSARQAAHALGRAARRVLPNPGDQIPIGGARGAEGWKLLRLIDKDRSLNVAIVNPSRDAAEKQRLDELKAIVDTPVFPSTLQGVQIPDGLN